MRHSDSAWSILLQGWIGCILWHALESNSEVAMLLADLPSGLLEGIKKGKTCMLS